MKQNKSLEESAAIIKDAAKTLRDANKVLSARRRLFNDKVLATGILESKYGPEEANRLIKTYWNFQGKNS